MKTTKEVPVKSKYKVGDRLAVDGGAGGDYKGRVTSTHEHLKKFRSSYDDTTETHPGVTLLCDWWDGSPVDYEMKIEVWDEEVIKVL